MGILPFFVTTPRQYTTTAIEGGSTKEIPDSSSHTAEDNVNDQGKLVMSSFLNRQGTLIRTYASRVKNPKGHMILVHGIRGHFRSDFCKYNVEWYTENVGEYPNPDALEVFDKESKDIFPDLESLKKDGTVSEDPLHGKNTFDVTPRFLYEGSFVHALNKLGYSAYGLDLQSHGLSGSRYKQRCYFQSFDDVVYDVIQYVSIIKRGKFDDPSEVWDEHLVYSDDRHDNLPYHLVGLSMGGTIVIKSQVLFSMNTKGHSKFVDGIIAISSVLSFDYLPKSISMLVYSFLWVYSILAPKSGIIFENMVIHGNVIDYCIRYHDPIHYVKKIPSRIIRLMYDAIKDLKRNMHQYPRDLPTLFIHSKDDPMCSIKGPKYYINTFFKDSDVAKLHELEGKTHVITKPSHVQTITPILKEWFDTL